MRRLVALAALAFLAAAAGPEVTVAGPQLARSGQIVPTGAYTYHTVVGDQDCTLQYWPPEASALLGTNDVTTLTDRINASLDTSPRWNAASGSPRRGTMSELICALVNSRHMAHELADVLAQRGYGLVATSARLISTGPVAGYGRHHLLTAISTLAFAVRRAGEGG